MTNELSVLTAIRKALVLGVLAFVVAACGNSEAPGPNPEDGSTTAASSASKTLTDPPRDATPDSAVRSLEFKIAGVDPVSPLPTPTELSITGGCVGSSPLSIGLSRGSLQTDDYFRFAITSTAPVAPGQLGEVELSNVTWDDGVTRPANLPADSPVRIPNRYEGAGVLNLQLHSGTGLAGRMRGVVTGDLSNRASDDVASLNVNFDINLACAN